MRKCAALSSQPTGVGAESNALSEMLICSDTFYPMHTVSDANKRQ
jgi:hypothetical protein